MTRREGREGRYLKKRVPSKVASWRRVRYLAGFCLLLDHAYFQVPANKTFRSVCNGLLLLLHATMYPCLLCVTLQNCVLCYGAKRKIPYCRGFQPLSQHPLWAHHCRSSSELRPALRSWPPTVAIQAACCGEDGSHTARARVCVSLTRNLRCSRYCRRGL